MLLFLADRIRIVQDSLWEYDVHEAIEYLSMTIAEQKSIAKALFPASELLETEFDFDFYKKVKALNDSSV